MKITGLFRYLLNLAGGLMLLAVASGAAQAVTPAKSLTTASIQQSVAAVDNEAAGTAKFQNVYYYYRRFYRRRYFFRPRYHYYRRHYYYYHRPFFFRRPLIVF